MPGVGISKTIQGQIELDHKTRVFPYWNIFGGNNRYCDSFGDDNRYYDNYVYSDRYYDSYSNNRKYFKNHSENYKFVDMYMVIFEVLE